LSRSLLPLSSGKADLSFVLTFFFCLACEGARARTKQARQKKKVKTPEHRYIDARVFYFLLLSEVYIDTVS